MPMTLLEMRDATFRRGSAVLAAPFSVDVAPGERVARSFASAREAAIVALMAAGIAKATGGRVFVGEFDPRIQPVQVRRLVGYVPHEAVPHEFTSFEQYIEYRAMLWNLPRAGAVATALALRDRLEEVHEAFAYPLIGALIAEPSLLVLDRPQSVYARQTREVAGSAAIFSTHLSEREARRFWDG
ncbi:MAG: hypothetical protein M3M96_05065 [Candidatus Eremiobacteraeota bacterium]|nr:hypothetical protein [Candidatus Eremiobacteraeota bacterium]